MPRCLRYGRQWKLNMKVFSVGKLRCREGCREEHRLPVTFVALLVVRCQLAVN